MEAVTLIIAVIALVVAVLAFVRAGGIQDVRRQVDALSVKSEGLRERTADAVGRLEGLIRGKDKPPSADEAGRGSGPAAE